MPIRLTRSERKTLLEILRVALHNRDSIESFVTDSSLSQILLEEVVFEPRGKAHRSLIDAASKLDFGIATILEELSEKLDREDLHRWSQAFRTREGGRQLLNFLTLAEDGSSLVDKSELIAEGLFMILSIPVPVAIEWFFFRRIFRAHGKRLRV